MKTIFTESEYEDTSFSCDKCNWKGKGRDANVIDFYGVVSEKEIHCPNCDRKLGIIEKDDASNNETASDSSFQTG